ncbi:hypothetical protein ASA1KI_00150 [Opitutales bacterium ASA1]|uniref:hypothetical protein n=1 Tax=Congregicoccus parvus TaxID=3081749 RepID=UPI002B2F5D38|nr:hypothetical protein ASA1KI_00150 [Opitutales bacterium ASA1]
MKSFRTRDRGSVMGAALVLALALAVVLAGLVGWTNTEARITRRHVLATHARLAAESTSNFAIGEIQRELLLKPYFQADLFTAGVQPPSLPPAGLLGPTLQNLGTIGAQGISEFVLGSESPDTVATTANGIVIVPERVVVSPVSAWAVTLIDPANPLYAADPLRGQSILTAEVTVLARATARDTATRQQTTAHVEERLQIRDIPVFGYMTFYNMDLEMAPVYQMDVHGPVHTNGNLYVQTAERVSFHSPVTSAAGIFHGRKPGVDLGVYDDPVTFLGADGTQKNMFHGGAWLQSTHSNWVDLAPQLWGTNVRDAALGVSSILPPAIPGYHPDNPNTPLVNERVNSARVLIEPQIPKADGAYPGDALEMQKLSSKACLIIEVTTNLNNSGGTLTPSVTTRIFKQQLASGGTHHGVTNSGTGTVERIELAVPAGLVTPAMYYDGRRARNMASADIDIGVLKAAIESTGSGVSPVFNLGSYHFTPGDEWNGIVYVQQSNTTNGAVRTVNAAEIPNRPTTANGNQKGFTLATNGPLYLKGNYNADGAVPADTAQIVDPDDVDEPPAALIADAITILSTAWQDANSSLGMDQRIAGQTEIAAAVIAGIVPSGGGKYSGGSHNLLRMLEDWRGVKQGLRTSFVVMFESEVAHEAWAGQNPIYEPPQRIFGLNELFRQGVMPPGTPTSRSFRRISQRELNQAEYQAALTALGES